MLRGELVAKLAFGAPEHSRHSADAQGGDCLREPKRLRVVVGHREYLFRAQAREALGEN